MSHALNADKANSITNNATAGFEEKDLEKLEDIYDKIREKAGRGGVQIRIDRKLQRDVFNRLEDELDFRVVEFEDFGPEGDYVTFISWRDSDIVKFSDFSYRGGGFPIGGGF